MSRLKKRHSGSTPVSEQKLLNVLNVPSRPSNLQIWGSFKGNRLVSWVAVKYGSVGDEKVWVILCMFTSEFQHTFKWTESLALLITKAFDYSETNGYYAYIYSIATRLERVYERSWRDNVWLPPRDRYTKERMCIVPAGELAVQNWQQRLLGGVKEHDTSILVRRLKKEYYADFNSSSSA